MGSKTPSCLRYTGKQKQLSPSALSKKSIEGHQQDSNEGGETLLLQLPKLKMIKTKSHKPRLNNRSSQSPIKLTKKKSLKRAVEVERQNSENSQDCMDDMFTEDTTYYDPKFEYSKESMAIFEQRKQGHIRMLTNPSPELIQPQRLSETGDANNNCDKQVLQLALLMDVTESMSVWLKRAKDQLSQIIDSVIRESNQDLTCEVCFVGYRDIRDVERFSVLNFTDNVDQVKQFIDNCRAYGGDDIPEDLQGGLKMLLCQDWKADSIKKAVLIIDEPGHGKQYMSEYYPDDYPEGNPESLSIELLTQELKDKDIQLTVFQLNETVSKTVTIMKEIQPQLEHYNWSNQETLQISSIGKKFSKLVSNSTVASVLRHQKEEEEF